MEKSNEQILLNKGYTFIKENNETGWSQIQVDEGNGQFTAFWVPNQLIGDLMNSHYYEEAIGTLQATRNREYEQLETLRKYRKRVEGEFAALKRKVESQRKSIAYYKGERDSLQHLHNKMAEDFDSRKKSYTDKLETFNSMLDKISEENMRNYEEVEMLQHRNKILTTICYLISGCFVSLLIFLAL